MGYDTIYAHQDKADDIKTGIGSSALSLGDARTKPFLAVMFALTLGLTAWAGAKAGLDGWMLLGLIPAGGHLAWQVARVDLANPADCLLVFRSNRLYGWLILIAIFFGAVF